MSKLGKLEGTVLVDRTAQSHFGPHDKITGNVELVYLPYSSVFKKNVDTAALFGPLKLNIILSGRIRLRIRRERSHALPTNHDAHLFATRFAIHSGSFEAEVGRARQFPFRAAFPRTDEIFPPSFALVFHQVPDVVDVSVQYRLRAEIDMPGIAISTLTKPLEIKYEVAQPSLASIVSSRTTFQLRTRIQNQHLLPADQQPQGFKGKAKAIFTPNDQFPAFVLDVFCTDQKYVHPGQEMRFEIVLRRDDSETTAPAVPDITLDGFRADLKALTVIDGSQRLMGPPIIIDKDYVQSMVCETGLPISLSKANDYSTCVVAKPLLRHASSFNHPKLSRMYVLKITMQFTVAKKNIKLVKDCPVVMLPAPKQEVQRATAGPSRRAAYDNDDEVLPSYEEAPAYEATSSVRQDSEG